MAYFVGISGWTYGGWRGVFYPRGLPQRRELEYVPPRLAPGSPIPDEPAPAAR